MELEIIFRIMFALCCLMHSYSDFKEMLLYDEVSLTLLFIGIIRSFFYEDAFDAFLGAVITGIVFLLLYLFSKGGMGFGDVKLAGVLGVWLGWQEGLMSLLVALWLGFIGGLVLILGGIKGRQDAIPFGPYMCLSGFLLLLFGKDFLCHRANSGKN